MNLPRRLAPGLGFVLAVAAAKLLLHLATASRCGYFGDELYYLACAERLDWGYVDQPPLVAVVAWLVRHTLGTSLLAIRLPSALAGAALVVLTGLLARELGGRRVAMALAAVASALGFVYVVMHYLFTMNAFEPLFWTGCAYVLVRIVKTGDQRLWLAFGALAGLGLQSKYSMAIFAGSLVAGVLLSPERRALARPWIWLGGGLALLIFLPNVIWSVRHGWPFFELMRNIRAKDYYFAPAFATLFAAGGVCLEAATTAGRRRLWRPVLFALPVLTLPLLPLGLPLLSPGGLIAYQARLGVTLPATEKAHARAALPHHFAFQFGWEEMVAAVAATWKAMPPEEQARVAVIGSNYAESGAVDLFGPRHGLPMKALRVHQSYWLWGPGDPSKNVFIVLGRSRASLERWCGDIQAAAELDHPGAPVWEKKPVLVCRQPRMPLREIWPQAKNWS